MDNEAKACLDDLALNLQRGTDTRLDLIGNSMASGAEGQRMAAQRAVNAKDYLVSEKGLDPGRISVFVGSDQSNDVTSVLVPSGTALDTAATPVNEQAVHAEARRPLAAGRRAPAKRHGAAAKHHRAPAKRHPALKHKTAARVEAPASAF